MMIITNETKRFPICKQQNMPRPPQAPNISLLRAIFVLRLGFSLWSHVRIFSVNTASCWKTQDRNLSDQNNHEKRWIVSSWIVSNAIYPHFMTMMMMMMIIVHAHAPTKRNDFPCASNRTCIAIFVLRLSLSLWSRARMSMLLKGQHRILSNQIYMRNAESFPAQSICTSRWWWSSW